MLEYLGLPLLAFQIIIFLYFILVNSTYTIFNFISLVALFRQSYMVNSQNLTNILSHNFYKPLSIIAPAYNEEETIVASLNSLLSLYYPEYEVIVVNDGSKDKTLEKLISEFKLIVANKPVDLINEHQPIKNIYLSYDYPNLIVVDKENGGKADALNAGINVSNYPIFCCIDADSLLENEALLRAARLFVEEREVIATGGIIRVMNGCKIENGVVTELKTPKGLIEALQAVEYTRGFLSGRTGWNAFGSLLIISGAFGLFRKDIVQAVKGYRHTVGEDMDLVVRMHKYCIDNDIRYKVVFVPDPICFTQVPSDFKSLLLQRNRWQRGLIDTLLFNKKMLANPKYGAVGVLGFTYFTFVEALGPIIEILGYVGFVIFYILGYLDKEIAILFLTISILWGMWINISSIILDNILFRRYHSLKDILLLCFYSLVEMFGYRQIITFERLIGTFQFWKKGWGKPKRQAIKALES